MLMVRLDLQVMEEQHGHLAGEEECLWAAVS
jgi:hypothetical protein